MNNGFSVLAGMLAVLLVSTHFCLTPIVHAAANLENLDVHGVRSVSVEELEDSDFLRLRVQLTSGEILSNDRLIPGPKFDSQAGAAVLVGVVHDSVGVSATLNFCGPEYPVCVYRRLHFALADNALILASDEIIPYKEGLALHSIRGAAGGVSILEAKFENLGDSADLGGRAFAEHFGSCIVSRDPEVLQGIVVALEASTQPAWVNEQGCVQLPLVAHLHARGGFRLMRSLDSSTVSRPASDPQAGISCFARNTRSQGPGVRHGVGPKAWYLHACAGTADRRFGFSPWASMGRAGPGSGCVAGASVPDVRVGG